MSYHVSGTTLGAQVQMGICDCPNGGCSPQFTLPNISQMSNSYLTVDYQTPVVGDKIYSPCMPQPNGQCTWEITAVGNLGTPDGNRQSSTDCISATTVCDQFINQMVPSLGGGGDIDCCQMLNGNMVGPYGGVATIAMLQSHCDVAWSMINVGGTFTQGNQLGTSFGWSNCCFSASTNPPCPPADINSPYHTNHNEFCANCGPGAYYYNHVDCPCCSDYVSGSTSCPPADLNSPYYTNYPEFCYVKNGVYYYQQPGAYYHNHPDVDCCGPISLPPQVGQYYCDTNSAQGNSCVEIVRTTVTTKGSKSWIPGKPESIGVSDVPISYGPFYNTLGNCESICSNHYPWNCWDFNNGNSSPNVSFPHITKEEKTKFCIDCYNTPSEVSLPGGMIKPNPYCWCLDNSTGPHTKTHAGMWSFPPHVHNC